MQNRLYITKEDIPKLVGRFLIEIDNSDHRETIMGQAIKSFFMEKRISFVTALPVRAGSGSHLCEMEYMLSGFYYPHSPILSEDDFVEWINKGVDKEDGYTHFRFLEDDEIEAVLAIKKEKPTLS